MKHPESILQRSNGGSARIELPFPVPLSACFKNAGKTRVRTERYAAYSWTAMAAISKQQPPMVYGEVAVYIRLVAPDKRARDADNLGKCVLDTLKANGVIEDDSNRYVKRLTFEWCQDGPPCLVTVEPRHGVQAREAA